MIVAADYVRDLHQGVIDDNYVVVNRHTGRTKNDGITDDFVGKFNVAVNDVVEADGVLGNAEANGACFPGDSSALRLCWIQVSALAGIDWLTMLGSGAFAVFLKFFFGAKAQVGFFFVEQFFGLGAIDLEPIGLAVGTVAASHVGALVPV